MKTINYVLVIIVLGLLVSVGLRPSNTYIGRYTFWNKPDVYDLEKFPSKTINASLLPSKNLFGQKMQNIDQLFFEYSDNKINLAELNKKTRTRAFLVLKNDSLICENYYLGTNRNTDFKSFSMAKSILSILVGIAIDEGKIKNVDQEIGEFNIGVEDEKVNHLTIENLLLQNSQLKYNDSYVLWADEPRWYYSLDVRTLTKKVKIDPMKPKKYENVEYNNFLMAMILEAATKQSISYYLEKKLWIPGGMLFDAKFSIDSEKNHFEKVADGFNAKALDWLNIGRIMLNRGKYANKQIVSENWVLQSTSFKNSSLTDKKEANYKYLWWTKPNGDFYANGHHGQYIYISPASNTVIVRLGEESGNEAWYRDIFPIINEKLNSI